MAAHYRIPHSEFLKWSQADRDKATWQLIRERRRCHACGTRPEEWDPNHGGHPAAYYAKTRRCEGCHVLHIATDGQDDPAMHPVLVPNPKAKAVR